MSPGSWVALEGHDGQTIGYGYFNPHSLIAFRVFERAAFKSEEQARALFFKRLDSAWQSRLRAYRERFASGEMGRCSFRLAFGESDGLPGLVIDLFESGDEGVAVIQCHSAGADSFIGWVQQWLEEKMKIDRGIIRNDLDVRRKENASLGISEWGKVPADIYCIEGGVKFFIDPRHGQKTGYFYDHRDNRAELARRAASIDGDILDCFSYVGGWGLQALKRHPTAKLVAIDVSATALAALQRNAVENGLAGRVEIIETDFFKDKSAFKGARFGTVICDPPSLTSSMKQAAEGRRALEACFFKAMGTLVPGGIAAFASCSYHLTWDEFLGIVARTGLSRNRSLRIGFVGSQGADHPILSTLPETRYLKAVIGEEVG